MTIAATAHRGPPSSQSSTASFGNDGTQLLRLALFAPPRDSQGSFYHSINDIYSKNRYGNAFNHKRGHDRRAGRPLGQLPDSKQACFGEIYYYYAWPSCCWAPPSRQRRGPTPAWARLGGICCKPRGRATARARSPTASPAGTSSSQGQSPWLSARDARRDTSQRPTGALAVSGLRAGGKAGGTRQRNGADPKGPRRSGSRRSQQRLLGLSPCGRRGRHFRRARARLGARARARTEKPRQQACG